MQSIAFVDASMQPGVAGPSKSPVFDFDDVWADHVLALRNTAKASLGDEWPLLPMEGVSPTIQLGVKPEEYSQATATTHWTTFSASAPVAHAVPPHQLSDVDSWMNHNTSTYGAIFPNTFGGYMMPIDQTSSTTSVSTLESPRSSRGSKRPPSTDDDEDEDSPLEFASSKAKRPRFDVNYHPNASGNGVVIASAAPANNAVFINDSNTTTSTKPSHHHMSLDTSVEGGFWETVQGPWEFADIPPPPPSHHTNAFYPVRSMPPLQVPVPRLPQQIWSAAAALGSSK
ncbi:hypothetical protein FRC04_001222 [Tulasnella sp. 424]|nr:hypothetical protein FRC04_001222 [Tulasnella sp. 424]KAG8969593.1 hypothetical protein FRC05_001024 [Tulasnella sp. 425]